MNDSSISQPRRQLRMSGRHSGPLFGRTKEIEWLQQLQQDLLKKDEDGVTTNKDARATTTACFVHGASGSGKTSLCRTLRGHQVLFLEGKFNQYQDCCATPYSALVQAFEALGQSMLTTDNKADQQDFEEALQMEGKALCELLPSFRKFWQQQEEKDNESDNDDDNSNNETKAERNDTNKGNAEEEAVTLPQSPSTKPLTLPSNSSLSAENLLLDLATQRLAMAFCCFLRHFCTAERPLILFLDDLQWSDHNSLQVLAAILNDPELRHVLFVGGHRDDPNTMTEIQEFRDKLTNKTLHVTDIALSNLDLSTCNEMVASLLSLEVNETKDLTTIIHKKTLGNPWFVLQFLAVLEKRHGALYFNTFRDKWEWDMERLVCVNAAENVVDLVLERIQQVPPTVLRLLQLAAFLGFQMDTSLLENVYTETDIFLSEELGHDSKNGVEVFEEIVALAEDDYFLEETGSKTLKFTHDRVRQLAYELLTDSSKRAKVHHDLGQHLCTTFGNDPSSPYFMLSVHQLNRGVSCISCDMNRLELVRLNLEASKVARESSAEGLVRDFLTQAMGLIETPDWQTSYDLVLETFTAMAEMECSRGNIKGSDAAVRAIRRHAKRPEDLAGALTVQAVSYNMHSQPWMAAEKSRRALKLLGVRLPRPNRLSILMELSKTRAAVALMSDDALQNLPPMKNKKMKKAMRVLLICTAFTFSSYHRYLAGLAFLRMMRTTLKYGTTDLTAVAFAGYGLVLAYVGRTREAHKFLEIASRCKVPTRKMFTVTTAILHSFAIHLKSPFASSLEPLLTAYRLGLNRGDFFFGATALAAYLHLYICSGLPLKAFVSDAKNFAGTLKLINQERVLINVVMLLRLALNLTGQAEDQSTALNWKTIEALGFYDDDEGTKFRWRNPEILYPQILLNQLQMYNGYILDDMPAAQNAADTLLSRSRRRYLETHFSNSLMELLFGLVGFSLAEWKRPRKYRRVAELALKHLRSFPSVNTVPLLQLLEARQADFNIRLRHRRGVDESDSTKKVKDMYDTAIRSLLRSGFTHHGAVACELAGKFMLEVEKDDYWVREYLSKSVFLFRDWGANQKVVLLEAKYPFLQNVWKEDKEAQRHSSVIKGRKRFKGLVEEMNDQQKDENDLAIATENTVLPSP